MIKMFDLKIITFKHGLFWYSCCKLPANDHTILHTRGLTNYRAINKLLDKLEAYYTERKGENHD